MNVPLRHHSGCFDYILGKTIHPWELKSSEVLNIPSGSRNHNHRKVTFGLPGHLGDTLHKMSDHPVFDLQDAAQLRLVNVL